MASMCGPMDELRSKVKEFRSNKILLRKHNETNSRIWTQADIPDNFQPVNNSNSSRHTFAITKTCIGRCLMDVLEF